MIENNSNNADVGRSTSTGNGSNNNRQEGTPSSFSSSSVRRTPSSGGFGRLRIDSPDYRLNSPSYQHALERVRQNRLQLQQQGGTGGKAEAQAQTQTHINHLIRPMSMQSLQSTGRRHSFLDGVKPIGEGTPLIEIHDIQYATREVYSTRSSFADTGSIGSNKSTMFEPGQQSPPLLQWIGPALLCALAYALYNIFIKKGSAGIHPILGGVILQFVAAILGCILCLTLVYGPTQEELFYDKASIYYSILAGVSVGTAEIISFMVSGMGVQAVQSIPTIIGGSVFFGTVLGWLMLREALSLRGWFGVAMIAGGITLVGMDPGTSLH